MTEPAAATEVPTYEVSKDAWKMRLYDLRLTGEDAAFRKEFLVLSPREKAQYDSFEHLENARIQVMHPHIAHLAVRHTADRPVGWVRPENPQPGSTAQRPPYQQHAVNARPVPVAQMPTHPEMVRPATPRTRVKAAIGRLAARFARAKTKKH